MLVSQCTRDKNVFVSLAGCVIFFWFFSCLDCLMSRSSEAKPSRYAASMDRAKLLNASSLGQSSSESISSPSGGGTGGEAPRV
jgi:hypothetical protein